MRTVILPGIHGSGPAHWQSLWELADPSLVRLAPSSWDEPDPDDWSHALDAAVGAGPAVLVAHSLACLLAVPWSAAHPDRVAGLFLVAPPDPDAASFPAAAAAFAPGITARASVPALLVVSDDDPYCSAERCQDLARGWDVPTLSIGSRGHINADSGLGPWTEGRHLLTAFTAGLAPAGSPIG